MLSLLRRPYIGQPVYYGFLIGLCKIIDGLIMVITLGYINIDSELSYMRYENRCKMRRLGLKKINKL